MRVVDLVGWEPLQRALPEQRVRAAVSRHDIGELVFANTELSQDQTACFQEAAVGIERSGIAVDQSRFTAANQLVSYRIRQADEIGCWNRGFTFATHESGQRTGGFAAPQYQKAIRRPPEWL